VNTTFLYHILEGFINTVTQLPVEDSAFGRLIGKYQRYKTFILSTKNFIDVITAIFMVAFPKLVWAFWCVYIAVASMGHGSLILFTVLCGRAIVQEIEKLSTGTKHLKDSAVKIRKFCFFLSVVITFLIAFYGYVAVYWGTGKYNNIDVYYPPPSFLKMLVLNYAAVLGPMLVCIFSVLFTSFGSKAFEYVRETVFGSVLSGRFRMIRRTTASQSV